MTTELVEIGFDLSANNAGPFLKLDDPVAGKLDDPDWTLGGQIFIDVTDRVRGWTSSRGKSRALDTFQTGQATVVFDNNDRAFDPTYTASPFYGQVIPKRRIRLWSNKRNEIISSTTNLVRNGSGEVNTSNVTGRGSVTLATTNAFALYGSKSFIVTTTGVGQSAGIRANHYMPVTANNTFTGSAWFRTDNNTGVQYFVRLIWYNASFGSLSFTDGTAVAGSSSWQRISNTSTAPTGAAWVVMDVITLNFVPSGRAIYFDGLMFNAGSLETYFDGSFIDDATTDYLWSGTPFDSTSTKQIIEVKGQVFEGLIDDWNLDFAPQGDSSAAITVSDGFSQLANQTLTGGTATSQLSGARINQILDSADVNWSSTARQIDPGEVVLTNDVIADNTNALTYLQLVERSEGGRLFVSKSGQIVFKDSNGVVPNSSTLVTLADDGSGIPYVGMQVVYGSELLYNQAVVSRVGGIEATANDTDSQQAYGIQTITLTGLLMANDSDVISLATSLVKQYSEPEFRFESIEVDLNQLSTTQANQILNLEIGDVVFVKFTPAGIGPAITKYVEVLGIANSSDVRRRITTLNFGSLDYVGLVLNDAVFGKLDTAGLG